MKHLGISGGGTKIAGLFGACESIITLKNYKPDIISGISAGAILAVPLALGKMNEIRQLVLDFNLETFFDVPPVKPDGKLRACNAIGKIIGKKHYLGRQNNLEKVLSEVVTKEEFEKYRNDVSLAICIVGSVDFYTGKRFYIDLKTVSYDNFLLFVNASASIPVFTPGVSMNSDIQDFEGEKNLFDKVLLFDGGVRDHSPSYKILRSNKYKITETCTIFSRPDKVTEIIDPGKFKPKNLLKILEQYIDITNAEISKNDEFQEKKVIKEKKIRDHGTIYLPKIMHGIYDVDKNRLRELYELSKKAVDQLWIPSGHYEGKRN
ncbi:MAG TPA: patatin-like phospholipase family protein [Bacteroidales bacterium]|nr:patatin-like phospholipase family protein [Bacteroidales bacterium]